ncbi:S41 family peptidase [Candidatus Saccharibacteria bacterium]|nr:S41 family peptidase [Candidatus Saccharibacteria bacterium]
MNTWKQKNVKLPNAIIASVITLALGVVIGVFIIPNVSTLANNILPFLSKDYKKSESPNWSSLDTVYNTLSKYYDGDIDTTALLEGAKSGLVKSLGDKYTVYMSKSEAEDFENSLHGQVGAGIGVEIGERDGYVRILRTLPDNPAKKAGILAGDILYKVNDEEVWQLTTDEVAQKARGEAGTTVKITVVRDGKELSFDLVREEINNVSAYVTYDGDIAIITATRFDNDTGTLIQSFTKEFPEKGIKKVILDLRGNGGGYTSAANDLASLWIDGEPVLIQKSKNSADSVTKAKRGEAVLKDYETIVLVNGSTASSSEIVAGALKDYGKATIIGEKTYGKGVVQTLIPLADDSVLKVTTASWYTPKDVSINKTGITPDIEVVNTYDDINAGRDPQLDHAKQELRK